MYTTDIRYQYYSYTNYYAVVFYDPGVPTRIGPVSLDEAKRLSRVGLPGGYVEKVLVHERAERLP